MSGAGRRRLGLQVATNTGAAILDVVLIKLAQIVVFALLVRALDTTAIAAIGIATGYLVLIAYADVSPIRVLLRDYPRLASDERATNRLLTGMFLFWLAQSATMLAITGLLQLTVIAALDVPGLALVFFAIVVDFMALSFREWIKTVFYAGLRQGIATAIGSAEALTRLACFSLVLIWPSLEVYAWLLLALAAGGFLCWTVAFLACFHYRPVVDRDVLPALVRSIVDYGIWDHLNRTALDTLFLIGTVVLSWSARLDEIAHYSIALRFTSLLLLVPMQLGRALQIALAYLPPERRSAVINTGLKVCALLSLGQLAMIAVLGEALLHLLFGADLDPAVLTYTLVLTLGATMLNLGRPLISVTNNFTDLRQTFGRVYLPLLVVGLGIYVIAAAWGGAIWLAWANLLAYTLVTMSLAVYVARHCPFRLRPELLSTTERAFLRDLLGTRA
jgi:O-antigen/teichoic acid export membrane protein